MSSQSSQQPQTITPNMPEFAVLKGNLEKKIAELTAISADVNRQLADSLRDMVKFKTAELEQLQFDMRIAKEATTSKSLGL